ncbi:MAG TPA: Gfo/Idh/MocA family oxidoreductase [Bryobacteraceae bacterium]|nr:Gfo/Idh/MocA family oxidoreductase [Bryobacteraceae bacterium]
MSSKTSTRRDFLTREVAATAAALSAASNAAAAKIPARTSGRVLGANDRINIAFIGNGMQFQTLLQVFKNRKQQKSDVEFLAVCDVWEPRLAYAQKQSGAEKTYRDYHEVLGRSDIDGVVLAVPDHWHYPMAREALLAGKDVYLEKPMTHTLDEATKLNDLVTQTSRILQVGGTGPATRLYWKVNDYVKAGKMGKILWGLISYNRNTRTGMWDYPIPGVGDDSWPDAAVTPENLDWRMWLGQAPKRRFSKERYFRWRKFWDYSTGNAGDLLYHRLGMMSTMIGFDFPTRAVGLGGVYVQKNREVPDTYMTTIEYPGDYCVNMISCMGNATSAPVTVYGNWATLEVLEGQAAMSAMGDQRRAAPAPSGPGQARPRAVAVVKAERDFQAEFKQANEGQTEVTILSEAGPTLGDNWLDCMRSRQSPVYNVLRGYQVMAGIALGVESYRSGRVAAFNPVKRVMSATPPPHKEYPPQEA